MESDPLLPRGIPAPEIQIAQADTVTDDVPTAGEPEPWGMSSGYRRRRRIGHILGLMWLMVLLVIFVFLVEPDGFKTVWDHSPWSSRTIEERVKGILSNTPLIGEHYCA